MVWIQAQADIQYTDAVQSFYAISLVGSLGRNPNYVSKK